MTKNQAIEYLKKNHESFTFSHGNAITEDVAEILIAFNKKKKNIKEDHEEKTTWIDATTPPSHSREVLIKDEYSTGIGSYSKENGWAIDGSNYWKPTHWIEIPQN